VARGLTNRQIATEMVITEGTAANYVQRVLAKLDFNTRAQIAGWAVEHGLASSPRRA
jgi:non-specific serine/threonine protein kinase